MKDWMISIRMLLFMTILLGLGYPLLMTGAAQALFSRQANGNLVSRDGITIGSALISQKFESPKYFWSRPSSIDHNPLPSGGSNLGPTSEALKKSVDERRAKLASANGGNQDIPQDLLFASGSGLDPEISPAAAQYQVSRIAKVRGITIDKVQEIVALLTENRQFGFLGEPRVNVLRLNLALDAVP